jgi:ribose 5-phosphate isomerase A
MNPKQRAAEAALEMIANDTVVGLGTGSTAELFIDALGAAVRAGKLRGIRGVPTSARSEERARNLGIPIVSLAEVGQVDIDVDGADEIDPQMRLIKGMGGALLREKIVAQNAKRIIIVADATKLVDRLGTKSPLPVEVTTFEHAAHVPFLRTLGCEPSLRQNEDGSPSRTDNGNVIYDCRFFHGIEHPEAIERALTSRAGIVETGLFLGIATLALVADETGDIRTIHPPHADS